MQDHDEQGTDTSSRDRSEEYDLIVEGTGLIESIVACAAAKCGKSILHVDSNDYYGRNSATFPLGEFLEWSREHVITNNDDQSIKTIELKARSPLLRVIDFQDINSHSPVINVGRSSSKILHPACSGYLMEKLPSTSDVTTVYSDSIHPAFFGYVNDHRATAARALSQSRKFMIDLDSRVLFSAGKAVNCLVNSGVSNYLEFKSIEKLLYRSEGDSKLYAVPCSKNEVFKDRLLGPLEKRNLTRFLQFAVDWGRINIDKSEVSDTYGVCICIYIYIYTYIYVCI
jgi:RAB protein geranylgeranyltransferase component A